METVSLMTLVVQERLIWAFCGAFTLWLFSIVPSHNYRYYVRYGKCGKTEYLTFWMYLKYRIQYKIDIRWDPFFKGDKL